MKRILNISSYKTTKNQFSNEYFLQLTINQALTFLFSKNRNKALLPLLLKHNFLNQVLIHINPQMKFVRNMLQLIRSSLNILEIVILPFKFFFFLKPII